MEVIRAPDRATYIELYGCQEEYKALKECIALNPAKVSKCDEYQAKIGRCVLEKYQRASKYMRKIQDGN